MPKITPSKAFSNEGIIHDLDLAGERGLRAPPAGLPARRQAPAGAVLPHDVQPLRSSGRIRREAEAEQASRFHEIQGCDEGIF